MKKITLMIVAFFAITATMNAQGGGFNRKTPEERTAEIHAKLDSAFKLEPAKLTKLDTALTALYRAQQTKMQEMFAGGTRPDRETMMAEMKKYTDARDEMIKSVVTEEQYAIWKEKIEPSMRPQRPAGGGGN